MNIRLSLCVLSCLNILSLAAQNKAKYKISTPPSPALVAPTQSSVTAAPLNITDEKDKKAAAELQQNKETQHVASSSSLSATAGSYVATLAQLQKTSASQQGSVGTRVDSLWTKLTDNIWGHASNVTDDIKNDRITKDTDTDGLHRIDRAIDEHIAGDNQRGLIDLIAACAEKGILIPVAHIEKANHYFSELQEKAKTTKLLLGAMKKDYVDAMNRIDESEISDSEDSQAQPH